MDAAFSRGEEFMRSRRTSRGRRRRRSGSGSERAASSGGDGRQRKGKVNMGGAGRLSRSDLRRARPRTKELRLEFDRAQGLIRNNRTGTGSRL